MKKNLWWFLLILLVIPALSFGAETYSLQINFSFNPSSDTTKQLLGYKLYKEGVQVCTTATPNISSLACDISSVAGTFNFTLTAYYSNNTESPHSAPFQFTLNPANIPTGNSSTPPTAVLSSSTTLGSAPLAVNFNGTSSTSHNPPIANYTWVFGDGSRATGATVSHTFTTAGTYSTRLTVTDSKGLTGSANTPIIVTGPTGTNKKPNAVIATTSLQGGNGLTVSFDGSQSSDPDGSIVQYNWSFGDGTTATGATTNHTYASPTAYIASLQVTDNKGGTATATKDIVLNNPSSTNFNFELGEVSIDQQWVKVLFEKTYSHPVVVAGPPSTVHEKDPALVRIRNIDREGFEVRLQEWDYQDGTHAPETINYMVMEKGVYTLASGTRIEAAKFTGTSGFREVSLQQSYHLPPVILTQIITNNDTSAATGRVQTIDNGSFQYKLQGQQQDIASHADETIGYIAWEPGTGTLPGLRYETGIATPGITSRWSNLTFQTEFSTKPLFIAGMQTCNGADPAEVRARQLSKTTVGIKIEEEQSKDAEVGHAAEDVGYLVIGAGQ